MISSNNHRKKDKCIFGLIGKSIGYSFSKEFFMDKFKRESIHHYSSYEIFDIPKIENILSIFTNKSLKGCNITIPYKEKIIPYLNDISMEAKSIGSVNVIKIDQDGYRIGYNTDFIGFEYTFRKDFNRLSFKKKPKALILGTGGVSKSISYVLNKFKIPHKYVSRNKNGNVFIYENINKDIIDNYKIIINCTPLGTYPSINSCPLLPYQYISSQHYFYDLVYNPSKTLFLRKGEEKGSMIRNGLEMLHVQAEESWKIWNS
ncbi:shikimate dehydrogenase family protein [Blattabacterium cuenoti]|uniref:shikimate dehydrogenase family protein n=1 Tax=Blattabacterium cuenoti TaxID=1653831 RepID=UPI00163C10C9|nr:shikimate dehydrogenase [Blattabacterium cuenoti]